MHSYKSEITLNKNSRGCYILDTIKGCPSCLVQYKDGCYGECYAKNIADRYGLDFSKAVKRDFIVDNSQLWLYDFSDESHLRHIINQIKTADMPFVRIGEMGDPSESWEHTIDVCKKISIAGKPIVIITKHWHIIPGSILKELSGLDICINTSISALDTTEEIKARLGQYTRLKGYCKSVLRIVSCDFNKDNDEGGRLGEVQYDLFNNTNVIDTVFRPSKNNPLVVGKVINVQKVKFLKAQVLASVYNLNTYLGDCSHCPDMCGINYKGGN